MDYPLVFDYSVRAPLRHRNTPPLIGQRLDRRTHLTSSCQISRGF